MKVILLKELKGKGGEGDVIDVARGYANNYLLTQGYAVKATQGNLKQLEQRRNNIAKREETRVAQANDLAEKLNNATVVIDARIGEGGQLFGSITSPMIAAAIKESLDIDVDRHRIELKKPIKAVGEYPVAVTLYRDIKAVVNINVKGEEAVGAEETDKNTTEKATEEVSAEAAEIADAVEESVADAEDVAADAAAEVAEEAADTVADAAEEVAGTVADAEDVVADAVAEVDEAASDSVADAVTEAEDVVAEDVADAAAEDVAEEAADTVAEAAEEVADTAADVTAEVADAVADSEVAEAALDESAESLADKEVE